ncbi:hypothetical protein GBSOP10_103637 [Armatimonadetes bacterium GBS]|jgi:hypothetical protein|nr:MAG: hypothetical protein KatS3mg021_0463 [Fimbriimonadales bacterium]CUU04763.1 hypothetical protein GBSOP10_103637 [Armatimonadetes bacterium GBS]CUU38091.1 hypothetical protein GXSOP10_13614 [Armatimonadetes bacterium GXS]
MRKGLTVLGILIAVLAFAQNYVDITIGGQFIMRLRTGAGNLSLEERAQLVQERITENLGANLTADQITLKEVKKDHQYEIYLRGKLLITVTKADADAAKMSVKQLAEHWLKQLRETLPKLSASPPQSQ